MKDYTGAEAMYRDLSDPLSPTGFEGEAAYRRALALIQMGGLSTADSILASLYRDPDLSGGLRVRVLGKLGAKLAGSGNFTGAEPVLEELVSLERTHSNLVALAEVRLETGGAEKAEKDFSAALEMEGADTCRILSGRARARYAGGNGKKGGQDLERLIQQCSGHPGLAGALLSRGEMEMEDGNCQAAAQTLAYLRSNYPGTYEAGMALYKMALCDLRRGGTAEAIDKLNLFLRESPDSPLIGQVYFKLATANYASDNLNLAASNYALAAESSKDPQLAYTALANLARVYQDLEDWGKASGIWRTIIERFSERENIVEIFFNLGFAYSQSGMFELAHEVYSRIPAIAKTEEQEGRAHYWTGISLKNMGRYDEAVREFLRVPYLKTGGMWGVTSKLEAAVCYEMLGRYDEAEKIYRQVIASHGENSQWGGMARKALDKLEGRRQQPGKSDDTNPSG
jgi:tetratricopeptide (TPR) repeat protein